MLSRNAMQAIHGNKICGRRGSVTLEFSILLPLLTSIALLCVDYGRFVHSYIAVTNAARAGAGYASMHPVAPARKPAWDAAVRQAVDNELAANSWFDSGQLTMPSPVVINDGDDLWRIVVEVSYPFQTVINWPFLPGYNDPVTLRKVVVVRAIR